MKTEDHFYAHGSQTQGESGQLEGVQQLHIMVKSVNTAVNDFQITLTSSDYNNLNDRLQAPILKAQNVVIKQSLSDRFLDAWREQVQANGVMTDGQMATVSVQDAENCIGCFNVR